MSGADASALEAILEGWCAKSRCHNCSEEIVISQCQGEENDAQSFYAIIPKIMPSPNKFNRDVAHCVSANQTASLSRPAVLPAKIFITYMFQQLLNWTERLCMA